MYQVYTYHIHGISWQIVWLTHLNISAIEEMCFHVERETLCLHNSSIQILFKLNTLKGVQVITPSVWNQAVNKNIVQVCWAPLIAGVWQIQLIRHVLCKPLRQFKGKKLQKGDGAGGKHTGKSVCPLKLKITAASATWHPVMELRKSPVAKWYQYYKLWHIYTNSYKKYI